MNNDPWWSLSFGRIIGAKFLAEGGTLPRGYGVAWPLPYSMRYYCLPVPLNLIFGGFRDFWLRVRRPVSQDPIDEAWRQGYGRGFSAGQENGMIQGARLATLILNGER